MQGEIFRKRNLQDRLMGELLPGFIFVITKVTLEAAVLLDVEPQGDDMDTCPTPFGFSVTRRTRIANGDSSINRRHQFPPSNFSVAKTVRWLHMTVGGSM